MGSISEPDVDNRNWMGRITDAMAHLLHGLDASSKKDSPQITKQPQRLIRSSAAEYNLTCSPLRIRRLEVTSQSTLPSVSVPSADKIIPTFRVR